MNYEWHWTSIIKPSKGVTGNLYVEDRGIRWRSSRRSRQVECTSSHGGTALCSADFEILSEELRSRSQFHMNHFLDRHIRLIDSLRQLLLNFAEDSPLRLWWCRKSSPYNILENCFSQKTQGKNDIRSSTVEIGVARRRAEDSRVGIVGVCYLAVICGAINIDTIRDHRLSSRVLQDLCGERRPEQVGTEVGSQIIIWAHLQIVNSFPFRLLEFSGYRGPFR